MYCKFQLVYRKALSWAQDYKEKQKLDSKQISDSAFGAHEFLRKIGDYKAF